MIYEIKAEVRKRIDNFRRMHNNAAIKKDYSEMERIDCALGQLNTLFLFIEQLEKEKPIIPKGLDEAAEDFAKRQGIELVPFARKFFKAGAKWMAEQGWSRELEVKEDAGGYPYIDKHIELYDYDTDTPFAKKGDKVIVQIRKRDE